MPVYDYQCKGCGHAFEREQRITDNPVKKCPECGSLKAKRLISQTSFVLKGSGWYNDLYASNKPAKSDEGGKTEAASEGKTDSKVKDKDEGGGKSKDKGKTKAKGGSKKGKSAA